MIYHATASSLRANTASRLGLLAAWGKCPGAGAHAHHRRRPAARWAGRRRRCCAPESSQSARENEGAFAPRQTQIGSQYLSPWGGERFQWLTNRGWQNRAHMTAHESVALEQSRKVSLFGPGVVKRRNELQAQGNKETRGHTRAQEKGVAVRIRVAAKCVQPAVDHAQTNPAQYPPQSSPVQGPMIDCSWLQSSGL